MPHIFICDDDEPVLDALGLLLSSVGHRVSAFERAEALLAALEEQATPDCVITDVRMPGMGGIQLHQSLAADHPSIPVIIVTGHADVPMAVERMKAGAADFLSKPFRDQELLDAIDRCLDKQLSSSDTNASTNEAWQNAVQALTKREKEVLEQLALGKPNKVIAHDLGISVRTLDIHRANIYDKMGVKNHAQLLLAMPR